MWGLPEGKRMKRPQNWFRSHPKCSRIDLKCRTNWWSHVASSHYKNSPEPVVLTHFRSSPPSFSHFAHLLFFPFSDSLRFPCSLIFYNPTNSSHNGESAHLAAPRVCSKSTPWVPLSSWLLGAPHFALIFACLSACQAVLFELFHRVNAYF